MTSWPIPRPDGPGQSVGSIDRQPTGNRVDWVARPCSTGCAKPSSKTPGKRALKRPARDYAQDGVPRTLSGKSGTTLAAPAAPKAGDSTEPSQGGLDPLKPDPRLDSLAVFPAQDLRHQGRKAGDVDDGPRHDTPTGSPQDGVISPRVANISLHGMSAAVRSRWAVISQADDWVVRGPTEQAAVEAQDAMAGGAVRAGPRAAEKTRLGRPAVGFALLKVRACPSPPTQRG